MDVDLKDLRAYRRSDFVSACLVGAHALFVLAPLFLAAVLGINWALLPLAVWFAFALNGFINLLHECCHGYVFRSRHASEILGRWFVGPFYFNDFDVFRQRHWEHHRRLGQDDDAKTVYRESIRGGRWLGLLWRCLLLIEPYRRFRQIQRSSRSESESAPQRPLFSHPVRTALFQTGLLAALFAAAYASAPGFQQALLATAVAYFGVYFYVFLSVGFWLLSLRAIIEHQPDGTAVRVGAAALRNLKCNPMTRLLFGAYGFGEHATHHLEPAIPYYRLLEATRLMSRAEPALEPRGGYLRTLSALIRKKSD